MKNKKMKEKLKILIIDDEKDSLELIKDELEYNNCRVYTAASGKEGVEKARELVPDLITLDIQMPGMDGFEVMRELKNDSRTSGIPVIIITVCDTKGEMTKGMLLGARDYIVKPFSIKTLIDDIKSSISFYKVVSAAKTL